MEQNIYGTPMTAEITSHLKCQTGTIATCALRRYISNKGNLFASYDWNGQKGFYCRIELLLPHRDVAHDRTIVLLR